MPEIYLDHASTTYIDPRVLETMLPYFSEKYGNAESLHKKGKEAKIAIDNARETVAKVLNCRADEIVFCGTATEANNLAIFGVARANRDKGKHLITSKIEHPSVNEPCKQLEKEGFEVSYIGVDKEGNINMEEFKKSIRPDTTLVSIMHANNEIGTIQPIKEIGEICRKKGIHLHSDACQTAGSEKLDVEELNLDLMTLNGSKIYGPKGIGALYIRKGLKIEPIIYGGDHESGLRAGTHNTPGIVGLAKALELIQDEREVEYSRLRKLQNQLVEGLLSKIKESRLNGPREKRIQNNINITIPGINSQELLLHLDEAGIYVGTGSACETGTTKPSTVLRAIGLPKKDIDSTIRITMGKKTKKEHIDYVIETLSKIVEKLKEKQT